MCSPEFAARGSRHAGHHGSGAVQSGRKLAVTKSVRHRPQKMCPGAFKSCKYVQLRRYASRDRKEQRRTARDRYWCLEFLKAYRALRPDNPSWMHSRGILAVRIDVGVELNVRSLYDSLMTEADPHETSQRLLFPRVEMTKGQPATSRSHASPFAPGRAFRYRAHSLRCQVAPKFSVSPPRWLRAKPTPACRASGRTWNQSRRVVPALNVKRLGPIPPQRTTATCL